MKTLSIDIETYSSVDLKKSGVYRYVEAPDFEILMIAWAFDDNPVDIVDIASGEELPYEILIALQSPNVIKTAFNANFERTCLAKHFDQSMPPEEWRCTAVHALTLGLPRHLEGVAKTLNLDAQKDTAGKNLIRYFSVPCKPTKANGKRTRNLPEHDPEKWQQFMDYCVQDVVVERDIRKKLEKFPVSDFEHKLWALDQRINDRGIMIDSDIMNNAIEFDARYKKESILPEMKELTGLDNPNSVAQLTEWLKGQGLEVKSLAKGLIDGYMEQTENEDVKRVLELRQEISKTSVKKYAAMQKGQCEDGRLRGLLQFYGANRTGRWAGRFVQVQNLPRGSIKSLKDLDAARSLVKAGMFESFEMLYGNVPDALSSLIRTTFIPSPGNRLVVSDFSAIEARVIAWLAGEKWRLDVFNTHGKIYEASAAQMFNVPVESITKGDPLRQKGKVAELALGYQGGKGALVQMGALDMGLDEEELPELVTTWRQANPAIVKFWYDVERAAVQALKDKTTVKMQYGLQFIYQSGVLFIQLPSGRKLAYAKAKLERDEKFDKLGVTYEGIQEGKWQRLRTYGGKLVENIVQAVARDCLAEALMRLKDYDIVMHVHDEVVIDAPREVSLEEIDTLMGQSIKWAPGLPLAADGFEANFYMKD
ncbi:DNA polymerase [Halalkalibacterium halodurans]|uniref:DNA polymerase n=1 Tax=Halalkalibacterium halodurans TaxID=86665 RepID=UPI002E1E0BA5|nr:DNA polymerase [Halalkalibacterium halodurans]MED4082039.1 DNA polymerase [Halalkalibacterium halodurans]MED4086616.1 DNA polymerase [Halalkalibacterium halodurans]MED4104522.1 DNA polymerase [Halalkalibacterium halodurans]MED4110118.1 DNA polymerase [Halalkalibacterium halodurans]